MASDWIRDKAAREEKQEAENRQREALQLREAEVIKALGPSFIKTLLNVVNEDIVEWNATFKERTINGAVEIQNGFRFGKDGFPRGSADVTFNPNNLRIEVLMQRSTARWDGMYEVSGYMYLEANPDGKDIHMLDRMRRGHVTPAGFSRMLLESVAEPTSNHEF
jgi:hypothetical protein